MAFNHAETRRGYHYKNSSAVLRASTYILKYSFLLNKTQISKPIPVEQNVVNAKSARLITMYSMSLISDAAICIHGLFESVDKTHRRENS